MRISAKVEYAIRAMAELAKENGGRVKAEEISLGQDIPLRFLLTILGELKQHRLVVSVRGREGGYSLASPPEEITLADIIRAVDGALVNVRDIPLSDTSYTGPAAALTDVWRAARASLRRVLARVTLADLVAGQLPREVSGLAQEYLADMHHHVIAESGDERGPPGGEVT
ncbi:RrF2 family transcriptional regulator [Streptomyces sp. NPDC059076]|uniref:RrF2 family transcriptional regulator n=1 Tax=unclassified Streptomyces TaxID=2593676 RepID=UPI0036B2333A